MILDGYKTKEEALFFKVRDQYRIPYWPTEEGLDYFRSSENHSSFEEAINKRDEWRFKCHCELMESPVYKAIYELLVELIQTKERGDWREYEKHQIMTIHKLKNEYGFSWTAISRIFHSDGSTWALKRYRRGIERRYFADDTLPKSKKEKDEEIIRLAKALVTSVKFDDGSNIIEYNRAALDSLMQFFPPPEPAYHSEPVIVPEGVGLDANIEHLDLSVRAFNRLKRANIRTIRQVVELINDDDRILDLRGVGEKIYNEIRQQFKVYIEKQGQETGE